MAVPSRRVRAPHGLGINRYPVREDPKYGSASSWWIAIAAVAAIVGLTVALLTLVIPEGATDDLYKRMAMCAWVISGFVTPIIAALQTAVENKISREMRLASNALNAKLGRVTVVLSILGILLSSGEYALWLSKSVGV